MSFKKKLLACLLAVAGATVLAFGAAGCSSCNPDGPSTGNPEGPGSPVINGWTVDGDYHWHEGEDGIADKAMHDWKEQTDKAVAATCSKAGSKTYSCSVCAATRNETVAQLSHVWEDKSVAATCTARGYEYKECTNAGCTVTVRGKDVPVLGHDAPAATCTAASVCTREGCGATVAPALGHDYELTASSPASCIAQGTATYSCSHKGCTESYCTVTSAPLAHRMIWEEEGATTKKGTEGVCYEIEYEGRCGNEGCSFTDTRTTEVTNHVYVGKITTEATCTNDGVKDLTCSECDFHTTAKIEKNENAHIWDGGVQNGNVVTFGCTEDASHTKQCVVYTQTQADVPVSDLAQTGEVKLANTTIALDQGVKDKINGNESVNLSAEALNKDDLGEGFGESASYIKDGDFVYNLTLQAGGETISDLGGYVTVTVPYTLEANDDPERIVIMYIDGNDLVEMEGVYANGYVTFRTNHFSYYTVTRMTPAERCEKFGHNYTYYLENPTCLLAGYELMFCTRCGDRQKFDVPAKGHDWTATPVPATCTAAGKTDFSCLNCNVGYTVNYPATGHEWTATSYADATCTAEGGATYECDNCTESYSVKLAQIAHSFKTTVIEATCTQSGHKHNECSSCGLEADTDYVAAFGHTAATKTVAPECTAEGFTLKYCSVCGEEIEKSNVLPAIGHKMNNDVCTECGFGCNHDYVAGERVQATCTADGYTPYFCNGCGTGYNGDIEKAFGHLFDVDECFACGEPNPAAKDYYLGLAKTAIGGSVCVTLSDFTYNVHAKTYENGALISTVKVGEVSQLDVSTVTLAISPDGEITGSGYGSVSVVAPTEEGDYETVNVECKLAVAGGRLYIIVRSDVAHLVPTTYASMDFDYVLRNTTGGAVNYAKLREYVKWYNTLVTPVLDELVQSNSAIVAEALKLVINNAFTRTEVKDGYNYVLDVYAAMRLNAALYSTGISAIVDKLLGEGVYAQLPAFVTAVLNLTPEQALDFAAKRGLDKDKVCAAIDGAMLIVTGEAFDSAQALDDMLNAQDGALKNKSVAEFIIEYKQMEITKAELVSSVVERVTGILDAYKDFTVYEVIASKLEMGAEDICGMISGVLGEYVPVVADSVSLSFATDKAGNVISAKASFGIEDFVVDRDGSDVPDGGSEPSQSESSTDYVLGLTGTADFVFGAGVRVDNAVVAAINSAKPAFERNAIITAYSNKELEREFDYPGYPEIVTYSRGSEMIVHTDGKGNIVKVVVTEERRYRDVRNVWSNRFFDCYERVESTITEYEITQGSMTAVSLNYCGDINSYVVTGMKTRYTRYDDYKRTYYLKTNDILRDFKIDSRTETPETYESSVDFYYNPKTKEFAESDPHDYHALKVNAEKSDIKCGGYYYMECEECGYHYNRHIEHLDRDYHTNVVYELSAGAKSCEDGVTVKYVCRECKQTVHSYTTTGHNAYKIGEIDLKDYGAKCGHTLYVYSCACGYYLETRLQKDHFGWWNIEECGDECDSFRREYMNYDGRRVAVLRCYVTDCGFNFAYYVDYTKDEKCWATWREHFIFGVDIDDENKTVSGGTACDAFGGKTFAYYYRFEHNEQSNRKGTENNFVEETTCADCRLKVQKFEHSVEYDLATRTYTVTGIWTHYKSDAADNTEEEVNETVETFVLDANGNPLSESRVVTWYEGVKSDENYINSREEVTTYTYGDDGKLTEERVVVKEYSRYCIYDYDNDGNPTETWVKHIYHTVTEVYAIVWVEDEQFEFRTLYLEEDDYFDGEGNPAQEPSRWHRYEMDYSLGYCTPVITETSQADGVGVTRPGNVSHRAHGEWITQPTCTQQGTRTCAFCNETVQDGRPDGHRYDDGVCAVCGLENPLDKDGRVALEDLSYTSQSDYVIGYYNAEGVRYSFEFALIDMNDESGDNERMLYEFGYEDSNAGVAETNYFRSGKITFSVAAIAAAAQDMGIENYMIRVIFVSAQLGSALDYSITVDAHNRTEGELSYEVDGSATTEKTLYCSVCGLVHGVGYVDWRLVENEGGEEEGFLYNGYSYRLGRQYWLKTSSPIKNVEIGEKPEYPENPEGCAHDLAEGTLASIQDGDEESLKQESVTYCTKCGAIVNDEGVMQFPWAFGEFNQETGVYVYQCQIEGSVYALMTSSPIKNVETGEKPEYPEPEYPENPEETEKE